MMVHRVAPLRLTGAYGVVLILAGVMTLLRSPLTSGGEGPVAVGVCLVAIAVGIFVILYREHITFSQLGWMAVASSLLVTIAIAARDNPYGAGYGYIWGTPFAFAASRRIGWTMV